MAKVSKNGMFSGRVGNLVYYVINGIQYVRAYTKPKNPNTKAQQRHRSKIKACGNFLGNFKKAILIGYQNEGPGIAFGQATKYHLANALRETTPAGTQDFSFDLIPEKLKLSCGHISPPDILTCIRAVDTISMTWNEKLGQVPNRQTDIVATAAWVPGERAIVQLHTGSRSGGSGHIKLPPAFTGQVHVWAFYWNGEKSIKPSEDNVSDSVYVGIF